jgi:hypothetical protein
MISFTSQLIHPHEKSSKYPPDRTHGLQSQSRCSSERKVTVCRELNSVIWPVASPHDQVTSFNLLTLNIHITEFCNSETKHCMFMKSMMAKEYFIKLKIMYTTLFIILTIYCIFTILEYIKKSIYWIPVHSITKNLSPNSITHKNSTHVSCKSQYHYGKSTGLVIIYVYNII